MTAATAFFDVAVLGAGNWGTTLAHLVGSNGHPVRLWTRETEVREEINERHTHTRSLPGLSIAPGVRATSDLADAVQRASLILIAIPSQAFREVCRVAADVLMPEQLVIHGTKGLENGSHQRMSEILLAETCVRQFGVLCGPNIASEVAAGKPAGTVVASHLPRVIDAGRRALASSQMMVFSGDDVAGVELAGSFKNIVAIAAGMATEMAVGDNAKAFLVSRGLVEITRLAVAMGAHPSTFAGLAGIGDLMVTCASPHSRNHRVGAALARGERLPDILARLGMVAEGVHTSIAAHDLVRSHRVEAPLLEQVHRVLYEGLSPGDGLRELMSLPAGHDVKRW